MDGIQSGMVRTGKLFAGEHWGEEPDPMTVGKSRPAGLPISAVVGRSELLDGIHVGGLGGTYCANPPACAAGLAVLEVFVSEPILEQAAALGEKLKPRFARWQAEFEMAGNMCGMGATLGFELVKGPAASPAADDAKQLSSYCRENGLVILVCGIYADIVRCLGSLVITDRQLERGLALLESGLKQIHQH